MNAMIERLNLGPCGKALDADAGWAPHPSFPGVMMKPLIAGTETGGQFKTLLVKIEPGRGMLSHQHPTQAEQHLVLEGQGRLTLDGVEHAYTTGALAAIPMGTTHSVTAGDGGMVLLALFAPA